MNPVQLTIVMTRPRRISLWFGT